LQIKFKELNFLWKFLQTVIGQLKSNQFVRFQSSWKIVKKDSKDFTITNTTTEDCNGYSNMELSKSLPSISLHAIINL
jgi:hypothetical protein